MRRIAPVFIVLALMVSVSYSQESDLQLQLTIKADKEVYEVGETIKLTAIFKNNSDKELIVFWNNEKPTTTFSIAGMILPDFEVSIPSVPVKDLETLYIKTNKTVQKKISLEGLPTTGRHRITLRYNYPSVVWDFQMTPNQKIWNKTLISNTINIQVVEKKEI